MIPSPRSASSIQDKCVSVYRLSVVLVLVMMILHFVIDSMREPPASPWVFAADNVVNDTRSGSLACYSSVLKKGMDQSLAERNSQQESSRVYNNESLS